MTTREDHGQANAKAWLESIKEMVEERNKAWGDNPLLGPDDDEKAYEDAEQRITESVLTVEVRSGWYSPGARDADTKPEEYNILLTTGGPALRLIGNLSEHGEPETARLEHQDWGTPWTRYPTSGEDEDVMLTFARCFYFGE